MHKLTLRAVSPVTHDVNRYLFDRPDGYDFTPGQATELAIDKEGWRDEKRPFTFVSDPDEPSLEFCIKSYPDHDGVTEQLMMLSPGDTVLIDDPWGAIRDRGPGVFIAGGAGITPFIPILRNRASRDKIDNCTLIFSNKSEADIILRDEWDAMEGLTTIYTVTDQPDSPLAKGMVDKAFLQDRIDDFSQNFYVCGPDKMVKDLTSTLKDLGADPDGIVFEE